MIESSEPHVLQLVRRARTDERAFAALYERYGDPVFRTAYLMLGDAQRAEELTQDVFVRVHRNLERYDPGRASFSTWLYRITINRCLSGRRRWLAWLPLDRIGPAEASPSGEPPPLEQIIRDETRQRIWLTVRGLPPKLRAAVILRYYHDLSYEDVALALDCPVGTVRSRLHAAHRRLRADLEEAPR